MVLKRDIHTDTKAALEGPFFYPVVLVYVDWPEATVRVHSGVGAINWDGHEWTGVGKFGEVRTPEEGASLASQPAQLRLIGLPDELDQYLDDPIRGHEGWIGFGCVTERAGNVLIGEPVQIFAGYMDAMRELVEASDGTLKRGVVVNLASGPSQRSAAEVYHTDEDQRRAFPNDTAGRLVINAEAEAAKLTWPA